MAELSIVILNYNTKAVLENCLKSLEKVKKEADFEVIVVDNASVDGSPEMVRRKFPKFKILVNQQNLGFAKGNNVARKQVKGKYILFLNSDTIVNSGAIAKTLEFIKNDNKIGAISCKVLLQSGELDKDTRRSFPTPWVSFTHFSHLDRIFPNSKIFAKYWYGYKDPKITQEVDVIQGAFFMSPKKVLDEVDWFDEDYFLDGEDIDLCWKIKDKGYKINFYPEVNILHIKKASKSKNKTTSTSSGINSMEIFYKKRMWKKYPLIINYLVLIGIKTLRIVRS
jgi:GT2 family glycosyltransferase